MLGFDSENFTGGLSNFIGPQEGCSTSVTMFLAFAVFKVSKRAF